MAEHVEGRWTITYTPMNSHDWEVAGSPLDWDGMDDPSVPVVPCDDAAIERAAEAVEDAMRAKPLTPAEIIEIGFRAAGETP